MKGVKEAFAAIVEEHGFEELQLRLGSWALRKEEEGWSEDVISHQLKEWLKEAGIPRLSLMEGDGAGRVRRPRL
jgi:hypothetical protein